MAQKNTATRMAKHASCANETAEFGEVVSAHEQVRCRAYQIYQERSHNGVDGDALADWIAAERELKPRGDEGPQNPKQPSLTRLGSNT